VSETQANEIEAKLNTAPWIHVYAQPFFHEPAEIIGTPAALSALRDTVDRALSGSAVMDAFAIDGEGYGLNVSIASHADMETMRLPYSESWASGIPSDEEKRLSKETTRLTSERDALKALVSEMIQKAEPISNLDGLGSVIVEGPVISTLSETVRKAKEVVK
jgi:hypothetical protein